MLRRYARALTGSQSRGDALVRAVVEELARHVQVISGASVKPALYRALTERLRDHQRGSRHQATPALDPALAMSLPRQAYLLVALQGLAAKDVMRILDVDQAQLSRLIEEGHRALEPTCPADVLIIHDEPLVSMELERIMSDAGHRVIGVAAEHQAAVSLAHKTPPQLIIARSILAGQGAGRSGFNAVADVLASLQAAVVVVSIHPEGLLTGDRREPTFVSESTFLDEMIRAIASQALYFHRLQNELPLDELSLRERIEVALFWLVRAGSTYPFSQTPVSLEIREVDAVNLRTTIDIGACRFVEGTPFAGFLESQLKAHIPVLRSVGIVMREL